MRNKVVLKVNRFRQDSNCCAVATCSSIVNFYNPNVKYKEVRKIVDSSVSKEGMTTPEQGLLLALLGLNNISIVTADTSYFDFTWQNHSPKWKINKLRRLVKYYSRSSAHDNSDIILIEKYIEFLELKDCGNNLIIDYDFPKWIKAAIRKGNPVAASINYTSYFKISKEKSNGDYDDIKGDAVDHAFVIRGFDDENIYVVDSNGKKTKEYNGYYKMKWQHFLVNIGSGDIILVNSEV